MPANLFLNGLKPASRTAVLAHCTVVDLSKGTTLFAPDLTSSHAYFLSSGLAVSWYGDKELGTTEIGMIGYAGIVGAVECLGSSRIGTTCAMLQSGSAHRILIADLKRLMQDSHEITCRLHAVIQEQVLYLSLIAACSRLHPISQRLARHLLMIADRTDSTAFTVIHEDLSRALGTQRSTVSIAAASIQSAGLISYRRGAIQILRRAHLEKMSCNCYRESKRLYSELLKSNAPG